MQNSHVFSYIVGTFMPRAKAPTKEAMRLVLCEEWSIMDASRVCELTHQSVSRNCKKYRELLVQIEAAYNLIEKDKKMFGLFGKKTKQVTGEIKKLQNRDFLEAVVGASILVAAADGEITEEEIDKLGQVLAANPIFEPFGAEIAQVVLKFKAQFSVSFRTGRTAAMREVEEITCDKREGEDLMDIILTIAESDGEISPEEAKVIEQVAQTLGLQVENHL